MPIRESVHYRSFTSNYYPVISNDSNLEKKFDSYVNYYELMLKSKATTITTTTTNATSTTGAAGLSIPSILGNYTGAAAIFPITSTMANLGIPLTGSTAMGFTIGIIKG